MRQGIPYLEQILEDNAHIIQIISSERWGYPLIDFTCFVPKHKATSERTIAILQGFLAYPYVIDDFQSHQERRRWRDTLERTYGKDMQELLSQNSLRRNIIGQVINAARLVHAFYEGSHQEEVAAIVKRMNGDTFLQNYDTLSPYQKVTRVQRIKADVQALLVTVGTPQNREYTTTP